MEQINIQTLTNDQLQNLLIDTDVQIAISETSRINLMKYPPTKASGFPLGLDMDFYRTLPALMKSKITISQNTQDVNKKLIILRSFIPPAKAGGFSDRPKINEILRRRVIVEQPKTTIMSLPKLHKITGSFKMPV